MKAVVVCFGLLFFTALFEHVQVVESIGCGEPLQRNEVCTDWQCSRKVHTEATAELNRTYFCVRGLGEGGTCKTDSDCYHELACLNGACTKEGTGRVVWRGYVAIAVAVVCFGSNFIPVKNYCTGNGLFFQFVMSVAILIVGLGVQLYRKSPYFYPYAMVGGMCWAVGNTLSVPVIQFIGIGLAITLWGGTNMIMGWCAGKYGFFGIQKESYEIEWMSYASITVAAIGIAVFGLIKPNTDGNSHDDDTTSETEVHTLLWQSPLNDRSSPGRSSSKARDGETLSKGLRRVLGVFGALIAGLLFGLNFDPAEAMMTNYASKSLDEDVKYSPDGMDYVFSTNLGIFLTSSGLLFFFNLVQSKLPIIFEEEADHQKLFVPAFISGTLWAVANVAWFVANTNLGLMVSFPVICVGPSLVANFWGIVLYHEIQGSRNLLLLVLAFLLVGLSCFFTVYGKHG